MNPPPHPDAAEALTADSAPNSDPNSSDPSLLVGEFPPPPPHSNLFGDFIKKSLKEGKTFHETCLLLRVEPHKPTAPLGIFGR